MEFRQFIDLETTVRREIRIPLIIIIVGLIMQISNGQELSQVWPANEMVFEDSIVHFTWNSIPTAEYIMQLSSDSLFNSIIEDYHTATSNELNLELSAGQTYYWRVKAVSSNHVYLSLIRKFSIFNSHFLSNLDLWLKADTGTIINGTNQISEWHDQSGKGNTMIQSISNQQPILVSNQLNGHNIVHFNGLTSNLQSESLFNLSNSHTITVFMVMKFTFLDNPDRCIYQLGSDFTTMTNGFIYFKNSTITEDIQLKGDIGYSTFRSTQPIPSNYYLHTAIFDKSLPSFEVNLYNNGNDIQGYYGNNQNNTNTFAADYFYISNSSISNIFRFPGDIAELLIFSKSFNTEERNLVESYLNNKYAGAPVNLGVDIDKTYGFCDTTLDAGPNSGSYLWSTGAATRSISANKGKFWVNVSNIFNYQSTDTVIVKYPDVQLTAQDTNICIGDSIIISTNLGANYNFIWSNGSNDTSILVKNAFDVYATVMDSIGCSSLSDTAVISFDNFERNISLGNDTAFCAGNSLSLISGATEVVQYNWSTGESSSSITIDTTGFYSITVTDSNYCVGKDTIHVIVSGIAPSVNFTFTSGCTGDTLLFNGNAETNDSVIGWKWNFGDSEVSDNRNPLHVYANDGIQLVSLTVTTISGCANTIAKEVLIYPHPLANFTIEGVCANSRYFIENLSISDINDPIISYYWNFGDGMTDTLENPNHKYESSGTFGLSLGIATNHGCSSFYINQIEVAENASLPDSPHLYFPPNRYCSVDTNIVLRWKPTNNTLYYNVYLSTDSMNFQTNLKIISFLRSDSIDVTLEKGTKVYWKVFSYNICGDSVSSIIHSLTQLNLKSIQSLYFWLAADTGVLYNGSGDISLWQDLSGGNTNLIQQSSNSKPFFASDQINGYPAVLFDGTTDYLKSAIPLNFSDTPSLTIITVLRYSLNNIPNICIYQLGDNFTTSSTGFMYLKNSFKTEDLQLKGNIGYNTFRSNQIIDTNFFINTSIFDKNEAVNEVHFFKNGQMLSGAYANSSDNTNNFAQDYFYIGYSTISGMNVFAGEIAEIICFKSVLSDANKTLVEKYIHDKYSKPPVFLYPKKQSPYSFCNLQLNAGTGYKSYEWSTADSTHEISVTNSGIYTVTVTDLFGFHSCDSVIVEYPKIPFGNSITFCLGDSVSLNAQPGPGYNFKWSKPGNDSISNDSILKVTQAGTYWVKVMDSLGCFRMDTVVISVDSFPAVASLGGDTAFACIGDYYGLQSGGNLASAYLWNNGDTSSQVQIHDPGIYAVTVTDQFGCSAKDSIFLLLKGLIPHAIFNAIDSVCLGEPILFQDLSHPDPTDTIATITQWAWNFGDSVTTGISNPSHTYVYPGFHNVSLIVTTDSGCMGNTSQNVYVFPLPHSRYFTNMGCSGVTVPFSDQSSCETNKITGWNWNFGDPLSGSANISSDSATSHIYQNPGSFAVQLAIITEKGCKDTLLKQIEIVESPAVNFSSSNACFGTPVYFSDITQYQAWSQATAREWDFGDGSPTSNLANPMHLYTDSSGYYPVKLTVRTPQCIVPKSKMVLVNPNPIAQFNASDLCVNTPYLFTDLSTISYGNIISRTWIFDTLGTSTLTNPIVVFPEPGIYHIQLVDRSDQDCLSDTTSYTIEVYSSPVSGFTSQTDLQTQGYNVTFENNSSPDASNFFWDFGDNSYSLLANPQHEYAQSGYYTVYLVSYNPNNCSDTSNNTINLTYPSMDIAVVEAHSTIENDKIVFSANLTNPGTRTITELNLIAQVDNGIALNEKWTGALEPSETIEYLFSSSLQVYQSQNLNYYCISAEIPGFSPDIHPSNNQVCNTFHKNFLVIDPYPSPTNGLLNIDFLLPEKGNVTIELYDSKGTYVHEIYSGSGLEGFNKVLLSTVNLNRGVYAYKLSYNGNVEVKRFIK